MRARNQIFFLHLPHERIFPSATAGELVVKSLIYIIIMAKSVTFGEIMLMLATPGHLRFSQTHEFEATFGGGEANVAVSLSNYGEDAHFVTALPDNDIAKACLAELRGLGVDVNHCIKSGDRMGDLLLGNGCCREA